jgi:hypothetical protein
VGPAALVTIALLLGLGACGSDDGTTAERTKAEELQAALAPLDLDGVDDLETSTLISLYGTDGGKVCAIAEDPGAMEREGLIAHPRFALRKTEADPDAVAYAKAVIEVYCPDQLANVEDYIEGLRVDDGN